MGTFTNIANAISSWAYSGSNANVYLEVSSNMPSLYDPKTIVCSPTRSTGEVYINVTSNTFLRTGIVSGHVYYACYWARALNNGTKTTDLYIGKSIDSEADCITSGTVVPNKAWVRVSGIKALSDSGGRNARIDFNTTNTTNIYMGFSGFLVVDLTNSGIANKSKAWCDDHLYYVNPGASGSFTDYDLEGTETKMNESTYPNASDLYTIHNLAANKANRGGTAIGSRPSQITASWTSNINTYQSNMRSQGSTYGTCGVVRLAPANYVSTTSPTRGNTNSRQVVNNLIRNADALYAQQYCVQRTNRHTTCNPDQCWDCSDCCDYDCCYKGDCCDYDCCDGDCTCHGDCSDCSSESCDTNMCCESNCVETCCESTSCSDCCDNNTYCTCNTVCSCNGVCACNWV